MKAELKNNYADIIEALQKTGKVSSIMLKAGFVVCKEV